MVTTTINTFFFSFDNLSNISLAVHNTCAKENKPKISKANHEFESVFSRQHFCPDHQSKHTKETQSNQIHISVIKDATRMQKTDE